MGFGEAVGAFFGRYFDFQGRSRRAEYWYTYLFLMIVLLVGYAAIFAVAGDGGGSNILIGLIGAVLGLFYLAILIPGLAIAVRRLHDTDRSGWWLLITFIPFASIVLLVFFCMAGTVGPNKYGPDPKGGVRDDVFA
ncbi:DUF805 domain-containing protein [Henriciella litoralis]|uniref:DUF805 domain-containing protein n=1 Tax=Henriciella litoralis TaxID=568102 RepID=UPI000A07B2D7|nr:DUF805 domain-containing protein [Henriciella litoralis]